MKKLGSKILLFTLFLTVFSLPLSVQAGDYPTRAIKAIVPWGPGSGSDVYARGLTGEAAKYLGQPLAITNMGGAGGTRGANYVAKSKPDGYTVMITSQSCMTIYPNIAAKPAYTLNDFTPICLFGLNPRVFVARSDAPWNSVKEVLEDARKNPGKIRMTTVGITSWGAFAYYGLKDAYPNAEFVPIHLGGTQKSVLAILRGDADVMGGSHGASKAQLDAGKFKAIGVAGETRSKFLPDVPTLKEQGVELRSDFTIFAAAVPKGTPEEAVVKLEQSFRAMCQDPITIERAQKIYFDLDFKGRKEAMEILSADSAKYGRLAKKFDLKIKEKK
jgi:tripartite-type tricarboxylate transporter receptor subunit TctC